ncbi:hypothetical protein Cob_v007038 [Colletotrichum orbiculare MAFF 240422]|uniref:ABM domain-containing protein n=1 Tax=Colletotrichum orbiculare (strain 104-T / ATCC 96160 / CBS 514.97 / LARS 414 / MAFF 240422) TaxID=1213857 RepID=N4V571_COLOR|nr:hypothetical protein Cob_v007038 [Colletotrichum orbiculare MAFF 240422]
MSASKPELAFQVTIHLAPEDVDKFLEISRPAFERIKSEPGLTFFELYRSPEDPGALSWSEKWTESIEYILQEHVNKDYMKEYLAATEPMFTKPREVKFLNPIGPPFYYQKA